MSARLERKSSHVGREFVSTHDPVLVLQGDRWERCEPAPVEVDGLAVGFGVIVGAQGFEIVGDHRDERFLTDIIDRGLSIAFGVAPPDAVVGTLFIRSPLTVITEDDGKTKRTRGRFGAFIRLAPKVPT